MSAHEWIAYVDAFRKQDWEGVVREYEKIKQDFVELKPLPRVHVCGIPMDATASNGAAFAAAQDIYIRAKRMLQHQEM